MCMTRRGLIVAAGAVMTVSGAQAATRDAIRQPDEADDTAFIERAFQMRDLAVQKGDQPYGALIVRDGVIIGQSWSRVVLDTDPTGHAEMAAIRDAAARTANRSLAGSIMYSSSKPCPMCEAAAHWAGISEMRHGRDGTSAGRPNLCW